MTVEYSSNEQCCQLITVEDC